MQAAAVTHADVDAAQAVLDDLRAACAKAKEVSDARTAAAKAAQGKEQSDTDQVADEAAESSGTLKKRRVAMYIIYNGHGYSGMQMNPGVQTIESALHKALVATGGLKSQTHDSGQGAAKVAEPSEDLRVAYWSRAARTDKGVSAAGQVVSLWLWLVPNIVAKVNAELPPQIRVLGIKRAKPSFDARHQCDSRRYEYCLPEWAFDPDLFPLRPAWRPASCPAHAAVLQPDDPDPPGEVLRRMKGRGGEALRLRPGYSVTSPPTESVFKFDSECEARLSGILAQFHGVHNFHNFTPAVLAEQMSAQRQIYKFTCTSFTLGEGAHATRWVRIKIHGQSFLLNQIRKMVGMALAVYRGVAPADGVYLATDPQRNFGTPLAPELGLFLVECCYDSYNRNLGPEHEELTMREWQPRVEQFMKDHIYSAMRGRDELELVNYRFMETLTNEQYHFAQWRNARPCRTLKRPRSQEEREQDEDRERRRAVRLDELLAQGKTRKEAIDVLRNEFPKRSRKSGGPAAEAAPPAGEAAKASAKPMADPAAEPAADPAAASQAQHVTPDGHADQAEVTQAGESGKGQ